MANALAETNIWEAWRVAFNAFAGQTPVAWPAETFEPDPRYMFYAVAFTAAPPRRVLVAAGEHIRDGFFTVSVVAPIGPPLSWHIQKAAAIVAAFDESSVLAPGCVKITRRGEIMPSYNDGPFIRTPVVIPWTADA